jgi:predicted AlkP superfamily phosphohydrolase/phosphomutase
MVIRTTPRPPGRVHLSGRALAFLGAALALVWATPAHAYIGPGAGFAFAGSLLAMVAAIGLALGSILLWPFTVLYRWIRVGNPFKNAQAKRIVVLGFDGMDPGMATRLMLEGRLPNFSKLADEGVFRALDTSNPSMSPVAWSTFSTGTDPGDHGIFDFLTRDPCSYTPMLSSTDIQHATKVVNIGKYVVPIGKPKMKLLQKGTAFWKYLGDRHIFSIIQRVPITFPPVKFRGLLLSGMCVPDLRGSQGTFSFFSTEQNDGKAAFTGGEQTVLRRGKDGRIRSRIVGPDNSMLKTGGRMTLPFTLTPVGKSGARLEIDDGGPSVDLEIGSYSEWVTLTFKAALGVTVSGIVRFHLIALEPEIRLYMTPIHIDPKKPAMPISHPSVYAVYLARKLGPYATLGLAEDTWALNERVIDERVFLEQAYAFCDEREKMFFDAVDRVKKGFVTTVFDTTDRIQHMFYRYLDPTHPANRGKDVTDHADAIPQVYERADAILGRLLQKTAGDPDTVIMVISDHGFTNFRRGVNLNTWLRDHGYLTLKDGHTTSGDWFEHVDWSKTRAFSLGLTGLFINRKGRETSGIVSEGAEYDALVDEIARKLRQLVDPASATRAIRNVEVAQRMFDGPQKYDAPDLFVGYEGGYRNSWECATGAVTPDVFADNTKSWSGDHCVDPAIVPGIFFCNRPIAVESPHLMDISTSVMSLFGQQPPSHMKGRFLFPKAGEQGPVRGPLDPASLSQSGAAPGARIFPNGHSVSDAV